MKKIYKKPIVRSCIIDVKDILANSYPLDPKPFSLDKETPADPDKEVCSRSEVYSVWDNEW